MLAGVGWSVVIVISLLSVYCRVPEFVGMSPFKHELCPAILSEIDQLKSGIVGISSRRAGNIMKSHGEIC